MGDIVLDPFIGSGTSLEVAERLGRRAIGLELQPQFIEVAQRCDSIRIMPSSSPYPRETDSPSRKERPQPAARYLNSR